MPTAGWIFIALLASTLVALAVRLARSKPTWSNEVSNSGESDSASPAAADVFDACLRRWGYAGRARADSFEPLIRNILDLLLARYTRALRIPERPNDPSVPQNIRFHFNYIESDEINALAFYHEGYSFVGLTRGLVNAVISRATHVKNSGEVRGAIGLSDEQAEGVAGCLIIIELAYVVIHEYAHHFLGHVGRGGTPFVEFGATPRNSITSQTNEVMADTIAVSLLLSVLADGALGRGLLDFLKLKGDDDMRQKALLTTLIVAICDFVFAHLAGELDAEAIERGSHPPPHLRLSLVVAEIVTWPGHRPAIASWLAQEHRPLVKLVSRLDGAPIAKTETNFLITEKGRQWFEQLTSGVALAKAELARHKPFSARFK